MDQQQKKKAMIWVGRILSGALPLLFLMSAFFKLRPTPEMLEQMKTIGIPETILGTLAALEIMCVILYWIPATSVLGAVLFTGYLGGAILTHMRVGQNVFMQVSLGVLLWGGLYLREPRLWDLLPLRKNR